MMVDHFTLHAPSLGDSFRVLAFRGTEAISSPFELEIYALGAARAIGEAAEAVGSAASLQVNRPDSSAELAWRGILEAVEVLEAYGDNALYRATLRPRLQRLAHETHSRIWVDCDVPAIVKGLLDAAHISHSFTLNGSYPPVEHIGQYHETDLELVSRRLEREGIHYYFDHEGDEEKLMVTDQGASHRQSPKQAVRFVPLEDHGAQAMAGEAIYRFALQHGTVAAAVALRDYDYLKPALRLEAEATIASGRVGQVAVFGSALRDPPEATHLAGVRAEERGMATPVARGTGTVLGLRTGYEFELSEHPLAALDGRYLVTRLSHRGIDHARIGSYARAIDPDGQWLAGNGQNVYRVDFEAIPSGVPYRPLRRTAWRRVAGLEHALVDGPADSDYAQIDEHGRYHVRLLWDETDASAGGASTWLRMLQPHAGAPEGWHFPLRKGTEVLIAFVRGDPDRPVIVGTAHNPQVPSPVTSSNASQNVLQTGGENRLEIEDLDGSQYLAWHSPTESSTLHLGAKHGPYHEGHNATLRTDGDAKVHAGGARHITVGGEQTEDVQGNVVEDYHSNQTTHVDGNWQETIDAGATQTIAAGETRTVHAGLSETISGGETRTITGDQSETISASVTCQIGADRSDTIGADATVKVGANSSLTVGGSLSATIAGGVKETIGGNYTLIAGGPVTYNAPGGFRIMAPGGVHMVDEGNEHSGFKNEYKYAEALKVLGAKLEGIGIGITLVSVALERCGCPVSLVAGGEHVKYAEEHTIIGGWMKPTGLVTTLLALRKLN